ncbi:MAG: penicillin-binding protein 2 [Deltaproteobacteria bacterium]|nr:penicillin-binding protein 2 [Deltaproteobacteria bacterium]
MREGRSALLGLHDPAPPSQVRLGVLGLLILSVLLLLLLRIWRLQGIEGESFRTLSENNRLRLQRTPPLRGLISDRHGRVLVDNRPSFNVVLIPEAVPDLNVTLPILSTYLAEHALFTNNTLPRDPRRPPYQGVVLAKDVPRETLVTIEAHQREIPGASVEVASKRVYPSDGLAAHTLGYVGEVNVKEREKFPEYYLGDLIGKFGIEKSLEARLRGKGGGEQIEVDASGQRLRRLGQEEAQTGESLTLTIDMELQRQAEAAMHGKEGAIVVLGVQTGEVLAMVSQPAFDPNVFARGIRIAEWRALADDPLKPLNNRAVQGQYPPGSTFKVIMAAAALEKGVITPSTRFHCSGGLPFGRRVFHCWKRQGHGSLDLRQAIANSCDVYFYQIGQRLGIQGIADAARLFGMGKPLGIELNHEATGLIPDAAWKKRVLGAPWQAGETLSVVIGQGYVTATPLQMAVVAATVANGGTVYRPRLVKQSMSADGKTVKDYAPEVLHETHIHPDSLRMVRAGMTDVVNGRGGTGAKAKLPDIVVAGKTGTSQVISGTRGKGKVLARQYRDHAWFIAFAPAEAPEVAVACIIEHAGAGGGAVAAPTVRAVLDAYFNITRRDRATEAQAHVHVR